ncbi:MAG: restriction endonuclease subunit S [Bacteroidales bacterium]
MKTQNNTSDAFRSPHIPEGYKNSSLGVIPEEWEVKRLGEIVNYKKGFAFKNEQYRDSGIRIIRISDTDSKGIKEVNNSIYLDSIQYSKHSDYSLRTNDIVVQTVGSRPPLYDSMVGKTIIVSKKYDGCLLNQNMVVLYPTEVVPNILLGTMKTNKYIKYIESIVRGNANQVSITLDDLFQFELVCPPLPEQHRIATLLSVWDTAIEKQTQLVTALQTRKRALMQQLLTGKKRLPGFTEKWEKVKLGEVCYIKKGKALSSKDIVSGKYPVIAGGQSSPYSHHLYTDENVITISASGAYAGYVAYHDYKIWASDCSVVNRKEKISNVNYIFQLLTFHQQYIYSLQSGGAQPHIFPKDIDGLQYSFPTLPEQTAIASVLTTADKEIRIAETRLAQIRQQKKGLMQVLLTGKKRLII